MSYQLIVTVKSVSPSGETHQEVTVVEHSATPAQHIAKNMAVAGAVMGAFGAMADQAQVELKQHNFEAPRKRRK